ncbi:SDR family NAD(P)-dependent oxidoreductase [Bacillus songklensis]|uniref:SDR family NAD(P)-dependent oxidoreductase n=1 Tax=Bacillus songklensis TaxID=1069116 RepID=A0ABV8B1C2_9BACI
MFEGRVGIVTGGTSGIGLAAAELLAAEGAHIVVASRSVEKGEQALARLRKRSPKSLYIQADVTKNDDVKRLIEQTHVTFGKIDFAFNNAANDEVRPAPTHAFAEEDFDHLIDVTLKSVWLCMKYELQVMMQQRSGAIVNTSSMDAVLCSAGTGVYAAGKSGVIALTKSVAQEYGPYSIRVNSLCPGAFRTPMLEKKFSSLSAEEAEQLNQMYKKINAMGRVGEPEEAAKAVKWLLSDDASFVTGQNVIVDGGIGFRFE